MSKGKWKQKSNTICPHGCASSNSVELGIFNQGIRRGKAEALKEITWHKFDTELQEKIYLEVKRWKEKGKQWSGTYWTDCIFRRIGELLEQEKADERARWEKKIEDKITSNLDLRSGRGEWDGALMLIKKELLGEKQ